MEIIAILAAFLVGLAFAFAALAMPAKSRAAQIADATIINSSRVEIKGSTVLDPWIDATEGPQIEGGRITAGTVYVGGFRIVGGEPPAGLEPA
jgi:hypothetical protein